MIKVMIERKLKEAKKKETIELLHELRRKAVGQQGYIGGETLVGVDDPSRYIVIASWLSAEAWQAWAGSTERKAIAAKIEPLLAAPATTTVLKYAE